MSYQSRASGSKVGNSGQQKQAEQSFQPGGAGSQQQKCDYCPNAHPYYECPLFIRADKEIEEENARNPKEEEEPYWANGPWYGRGKCHYCEDTPIEYTHFEHECPLVEHESKKQEKYEQQINEKVNEYKKQERYGHK